MKTIKKLYNEVIAGGKSASASDVVCQYIGARGTAIEVCEEMQARICQ